MMRSFIVCCFMASVIFLLPLGLNRGQAVSFLVAPDNPPVFTPPSWTLIQTSQVTDTVRFAVIGDFGLAGPAEAAVANLVKSWNPNFIITTGDNNYLTGAALTIDKNIGQYYHDFIFPYNGAYGAGSPVNRFFPSLGNHDWRTLGALPYLDYFALPNNERYYDFVWGPTHFFALDSDTHEPEGNSSGSTQAVWLQNKLVSSTSCWNLVYFHHSPFSSGPHGSNTTLQWPYQAWGADAVLTGHDHTYERIEQNGLPYFVDGLGGSSKYKFYGTPVPGSRVRYNNTYGAMLVVANSNLITYQFIAVDGTVVDTYSQIGGCLEPPYQLYLPLIVKL